MKKLRPVKGMQLFSSLDAGGDYAGLSSSFGQ